MLKIVHLFTGVGALLLSFILPSQNPQSALLLASFALANLLIAPILPTWARGGRRQLQGLVSALVVVATAMQAVFILSGTEGNAFVHAPRRQA